MPTKITRGSKDVLADLKIKERRIQKFLNDGAAICHDCADSHGATWPKGHCATFWSGVCSFCEKDISVCDIYDYNWAENDITHLREL